METHDLIGMAGSTLIIAAYFLLQIGRLQSRSLGYSLTNLLGALCILYSLCFAFNMAAAFIETVWAMISLFGIWKAWRGRTGTGPAPRN